MQFNKVKVKIKYFKKVKASFRLSFKICLDSNQLEQVRDKLYTSCKRWDQVQNLLRKYSYCSYFSYQNKWETYLIKENDLGQFCRFDFGPRQNKRIYGSRFPPTYNLKKVSAPVAIYYAKNDILVAAKVSKYLYTP